MEQYAIQFFSVVINIILLYAFNRYNDKQKETYKKQIAIENGLRSLLRDRIIYQSLHHIKVGLVSVEDIDNITSLYNAYKDLNGNGAVDNVYNKLLSLPTVTLHSEISHDSETVVQEH